MKIAYILSTLRPCGPVNIVMEIVRSLGRGVAAHVVTLSPNPPHPYGDTLRVAGAGLAPLDLSRFAGFFRAGRAVHGVLDRLRPDVVHAHGLRADGILAGLAGRYATVSTLHCDPYLDYPSHYGRALGLWMARRHIRSLRRIGTVAAVSASLAEDLERRHRVPARAIQNGVDQGLFRPADGAEKRSLRRRLGLPLDRTIFVSVGLLSARKDPLTVVEAFRTGRFPDALALFLGDGPLARECRAQAGDGDGIIFAGEVRNAVDYLRAADVFLSASRAEGLPAAALEALSCGLPALLSDIPPHRELLEGDPGAGRLFPPGRADVLADAAAAILRAGPVDMGRQAARLARGRFAGERMAREYRDLYETLRG